MRRKEFTKEQLEEVLNRKVKISKELEIGCAFVTINDFTVVFTDFMVDDRWISFYIDDNIHVGDIRIENIDEIF